MKVELEAPAHVKADDVLILVSEKYSIGLCTEAAHIIDAKGEVLGNLEKVEDMFTAEFRIKTTGTATHMVLE